MRRRLVPVLLVALSLAAPALASAQGSPAGVPTWGYAVEGGASFTPDQFVIGGHLDSPELPQHILDHLTFRPTALLGLGSDANRLLVTTEFALKAPIPQTPWSLAALVGPGIQFSSDHTGGVVAFGVQIQHEKGYFGELKYLTGGEAQLLVGYVLKPRP
jgi:hypothetical protein